MPKQIAQYAFYIYLGSLALVSLVFMKYSMPLWFVVLGVIWVALFFFGSYYFSKEWMRTPEKDFIRKFFWMAVLIRCIWVIFSYFFYQKQTGSPFEFSAADSYVYYDEGSWLSKESWDLIWDYLFTSRATYSDSGYALYLTVLYKLIGPNIFVTRVIKAFIGAFTCCLMYRLAQRNVGEQAARLAALFCVFNPNLIIYCGLHLKELEMVCLIVAFLERSDYLIRSRKVNVFTLALPILLGASLFLFRTVLGAIAFFALFTGILFTTNRIVGKWKRGLLIAWGALAIMVFAGGTIVNEVEEYWDGRYENQENKRTQQTLRGNQWAMYATGTVMAPMMFVLPFPTMIDVQEQYNQNMMQGGNYARNFLGIFVLIGLYTVFFVKKNWRDFSLVMAFDIGYLGVICASGYANSERFLLPGLPVLLMFAAYGVTQMNGKNYRFVKYWYWLPPIMAVAWAYFKVGSRGLL